MDIFCTKNGEPDIWISMINTTKLIFSSFFLTCYGLRLGPGNCVDHGQGCQGDFWFRQILSFHTTRSTVTTKSIYLTHISQNNICCFTCFRKYRKTLRAEHMNVSLVTQHGTISGKVSLYLYLLTSWFLSRSAFLSNLWFHWYTNDDIYAKNFNTTAAGWQHAPTVKKYNRKSLQVKKYYGLTTEMFSGLLEGLHGAGTAILR